MRSTRVDARAGSVLADDQVAFPVTRDFPIRNVRALINQPHPNDRGFAPACWGSCASTGARGQANAVLDERLLGVGVDPRVDSLVAGSYGSWASGEVSSGGQCATRFSRRRPLIWRGVCLGTNLAITRRRRTSSQSNRRFWRRLAAWAALLASSARYCPSGSYGGRSHGTPPRGYAQSSERYALDSKHPTTPHDQPPNSITTTRKLLTPYDTAMIPYYFKACDFVSVN